MKGITFIHAADLHLDSPFKGLKDVPPAILKEMKEASFVSFQKIVGEAISRQVDFLLLSGDLYDGEDRNLRTQVRFRDEMIRLEQAGIQVFIIHGNHDHLAGKWVTLEMPANVHVFPAETMSEKIAVRNVTVRIYGCSYPVQHVKQRIVDTYRKMEDGDYHIAMLHGNMEGQSGHGNYAPFSLKDLLDKEMDYWALGHIHKRQELSLSPPIVYPGNIQGRHRKESGIKGCYHVHLVGKHSELTFLPASDIVWETAVIPVENQSTFDSILRDCRLKLAEIRERLGKCFLSIILKASEDAIDFTEYGSELHELLKEEEEHEPVFVYPFRIKEERREDRQSGTPMMKMLQEHIWTAADVEEAGKPLMRRPLGRKYVEPFSEEERTEIIEDAQLLLSQLLSGKGGQ